MYEKFGQFINGEWKPADSGETYEVINPATEEIIGNASKASSSDVQKALKAADQGFKAWRETPAWERAKLLRRISELVRENSESLVEWMTLEGGKSYNDGVAEVGATADVFEWNAEETKRIYGQTIESRFPDTRIQINYQPVGVVAALSPWNFPLVLTARKIATAMAAGCSVIAKPAEQTSLTTLRVAELAHQAGIPRGVFQVLPGDGPSVGEPLGKHMNVDMVSFTGSTETGKRFLRYAADSNLKKIVLECGGKNPAVVFDDAENLDHVAEHVVNAAFWNAGQNCSAASRLIIHSSIKIPLMERIEARIRDWKVGDPLDPGVHIGALIDAEHCDKVRSFLEDKDKGSGPFISPKIYEVRQEDPMAQEEIFGPVLSVIEVATNEEAIAVANQTKYGLTASVFTANTRQAIRAARDINAGTVTVNCYGEGDISTPFGGYKQSGFGGRDNGVHAHDQFTELKTIWIDLTNPVEGDNIG